MSTVDRFVKVFNLPPALIPYVDLIVTSQEMELVVGLGAQALTVAEVAEMMRVSEEEAGALLTELFRRDIVDRKAADGGAAYTVGNFYTNMDFWTGFEVGSWQRLPPQVRGAVSEWQMEEWLKLWEREMDIIRRDPDTYVRMKNRDVLLLEEALDLVGAAEAICLLPCACKTTTMPGSPIIEGSMRLGARARQTLERGQGRSLTVDEAKAHLLALDRMGLIHTGPRAWRAHDPQQEWISHGNCHPAYSFPMRAGMRLGMTKAYPRVHHVARVDWDACTHCGVCIGRCLFSAFYHDGSVESVHGQKVRQVKFDPEPCWGCGLCASACPEGVIVMEQIAG
ncbi:MAG: 4Fe-4S dicluster domain-containing protein [Anaerolineae bacterium]|nr:4Fe-4S dicluster domain-containing protein [Anaerolineae bacterium]